MTRWLGPLAVIVATALAAHWATLAFAPSVIMDRALGALADRGVAVHAFTSTQRISPQTQAVVRSSPDLFYSLCRYDLSDPDSTLKVTMADWPDYQSLSFFDAGTNNFLTYRGTSRSVSVEITAPGGATGNASVSPTQRGVVLIRRLAPTQALYDAAAQAAERDSCELVTG